MDAKVKGKAFTFGNNIDTDQIYPGKYVEYTEIEDIKNTYQQKIDAYQEKYISFMSGIKAK